VVLHDGRVPGALTVAGRRSAFNRVIGVILALGAIVFVLLLAGVGSGFLTS
jgi:hypothetical protein